MNRVPTQENQTTTSKLVIFLDIDGVLNNHVAFDNGYCGMQNDKVWQLNRILLWNPDLKIVVSSAWRYIFLKGDITLKGLEYLFLTHGVDARNRIIGCTESDEVILDLFKIPLDGNGEFVRKTQIERYAEANKIDFYVVLDDLDLKMPELVQTSYYSGLTDENASEVMRRFKEYERKKKIIDLRRVFAKKSQTLPTSIS